MEPSAAPTSPVAVQSDDDVGDAASTNPTATKNVDEMAKTNDGQNDNNRRHIQSSPITKGSLELNTKPAASSTSDGDGDVNPQQMAKVPAKLNPSTHPPSTLNEEKIDKAISFLRNTEINDVSTRDKREYLKHKVGMTSGEIDEAFDRVSVSGRGRDADLMGTNIDRDEQNFGQSRERDGYNRYNDGENARQRRGYRDQYNQQQHHDPYNHRGQERRPPRTSQYNASSYEPNYNGRSPQNNMYNSPQAGGGPMAYEEPPQPSFFPAWVGGFSLGVFCLAALRWLNGGDFILFPPPTALESRAMGGIHLQKNESALLDGNEEATDESESLHGEENELHNAEDNIVDYQEEEYEMESNEEEEDDDDGINMILNGTTNVQHLHNPDNQQQLPSYDELVLEIRALTSAIHTYRDVQERANRAVTAHVGKGMTDDAMDFLRQNKQKSEVEDESKSTESSLNEKDSSAIAKLLEEVSGDLSKLKQIIVVQEKNNECDDNGSEMPVGDADDSKESDPSEKKLKSEEEPSKQIDKVMEKVQQMMAVVENNVKPKEQGSVSSREDDPNRAGSTVEVESEGTPKTEKQEHEKVGLSSDPQQEQSTSKEEATQQTTGTPTTMEQLEEALKMLANNNNPTDLKVGAQMLYLYCLNISKNPSVPRYRKIYTNNSTFRNKVGNLDGAKEFLSAVGFVERASFFEWGVSASEDGSSMDTKSKLDFALVALEMMKNGSNKLSSDDADPATAVPAIVPIAASTDTAMPFDPKEVTSEAISSAVSVAGLAGKGLDLN